MPRSLVKASWLVAGLIWSGLASAVGFGGATVKSALGQPLKVEISLSDVSAHDASSLTARLASPDAFAAAGIDYPYSLTQLKFKIDTSSGTPRIMVTSKEPVNDPFVSLLVELSWSSGRLLREYTFLIDPPGYKSAQPKPEAVAPIEPVIAAAPVVSASAPVATEPAAAVTAPVATPVEVVAVSAPPAAPVAASSAPVEAPVAASAVPVTEVTASKETEVASGSAASPEMAASAPVATETQIASGPVMTSESEAMPAPVAAVEPVKVQQPEARKTITVKRGDTLTKIAEQVKEPDVTLEQMLVALYRANASKFDGKNMNRIRAGKILRMPSQATLEKLSNTEAVKLIRIQTADWNAYKQKLAAASTPALEQAPKQEASGKISTTVADKTPPVKESAKEVLKLSKGEAPGDKTAATGKAAMTPQGKTNAKQEEAVAKGKAQQETKQRTAMLEKNVQEMQKLVEMKQSSAVAAAPVAGKPAAPATGKPAASAVAAVPGTAPAKPPVKKPRIIFPKPTPPAPSLVDSILGMLTNPLYAGGLAAFVLVGGLGFFLVRRRKGGSVAKKPKEKKEKKKRSSKLGFLDKFKKSKQQPDQQAQAGEEVEAETEPAESPAAEAAVISTVVGQEIATATPKSTARPAEEEEVDPISEAELFLNFGRDAQAEEILKDALDKNPANRPAQFKLLSIYANRKDANAFSTIARQIKDSGDVGAWEQVAVMGREVDPSNPEYGGTEGSAAPAGSTEQEAVPPALDMDIGFNVPMDLDVTSAAPAVEAESSQAMDFDISGASSASAEPVVETESPQVMDFDISGTSSASTDFDITGSNESAAGADALAANFDVTGGQPEAAEEAEHLDFDITGSQPKVLESAVDINVSGNQPSVTDEVEHLDFDVTGSHPSVTEEAAAEELSTVVLNAPMDFDISAAPAAVASEEQPATMESSDLTFDITSSPDEQPGSSVEQESPGMDLDLGGINLDLGGEMSTMVSPVAESKKDEKWNEVATKLDLAKAYQEMGDADGAREILGEVLTDGDEGQKQAAEALMQQL